MILKMINFRRWFRRNILAPIQRNKRGFSDIDAWSGDSYLAGVIANMLDWYRENGNGIPGSYLWDTEHKKELSWEEGKAKMDAEYVKYANIFRRYANGGAWPEKYVTEFNGATTEEIDEALAWFTKIFPGLWD
jgi:hypothetical protein